MCAGARSRAPTRPFDQPAPLPEWDVGRSITHGSAIGCAARGETDRRVLLSRRSRGAVVGAHRAGARAHAARACPTPSTLISYHVLTSGSCWGGLDGEQQVRMEPGDVLVFPHGDSHSCRATKDFSSTERDDRSAGALSAEPSSSAPTFGRDTTFVCGFLGCDVRPFNPLIASLPRCMHVRGAAGGWLSQFPRAGRRRVARGAHGKRDDAHADGGADVHRSRAPSRRASAAAAGRLARRSSRSDRWAGARAAARTSRASVDARRARAHDRDVADRARRAFLAHGGRDADVVSRRDGDLQLAAEKLSSGSAKVATIGEEVGYESEAAFSRAFKRETGLSPAAWRRARRGGGVKEAMA